MKNFLPRAYRSFRRKLGQALISSGLAPSTARQLRNRGNAYVRRLTSGVVQSGPFEGMIFDVSLGGWGADDYGALVTGLYERELHSAIEELIRREPRIVVNMGCALGYYAVGLKLRLPKATVHGVDVATSALSGSARNARLNSVSVLLGAEPPLVEDSPSAWFIDIEGAEMGFLDPRGRQDFTLADILVEVHEWVEPGMLAELKRRFEATHEILEIRSGGRDPNELEILRPLDDDVKWFLLSEGRPMAMTWLWMKSKSRS